MAKKTIPDHIRTEVAKIIDGFNKKHKKSYCTYIPRYKGSYLYLDRDDDTGEPEKICRLKYTGDMKGWEFAIFKYSSERYDPDEWMFAGSECVNGTVEGALKAGMKAYP